MGVGFHAATGGSPNSNSKYSPPLCKTGTHLRIFSQPFPQAIQSPGYFLPWKTRHGCSTGIHFNSWYNAFINNCFYDERAVSFLLTDCFIIQYRTANILSQAGGCYHQFPPIPSCFFGL